MRRSVVATIVAALLLLLTVPVETASATGLDPSATGLDPSATGLDPSGQGPTSPARTATATDSLTSSDADTAGPGPGGISVTDQEYDVDCSGRSAQAGAADGAGRRAPLSIAAEPGQGSSARVVCAGGAS
jgi:hypothetical protein